MEDEESILEMEYLKPALDEVSEVVRGVKGDHEESIEGFQYLKPALDGGLEVGLSPGDDGLSGSQVCKFKDGHRIVVKAQVEHQILEEEFDFSDCAELGPGLETSASAHMEMQVDHGHGEEQVIGHMNDSASDKI